MNKFERYTMLYNTKVKSKYNVLYNAHASPTSFIPPPCSGDHERCEIMACTECNEAMLVKWFHESISTTEFWSRHSAVINRRADLVVTLELPVDRNSKEWIAEMLHQRDHVLQFMEYQKRPNNDEWDNKDGGYSDGETIVSGDWKCERIGCRGIVGQ